LRKRSKNRKENLEREIPVPNLQSSDKNAKGETAAPVNHLYVEFGQANLTNYNSAHFNQQESHYADPIAWERELQKNPPKTDYVGINDLKVPPPGGNYMANASKKISRAGYDDIPAPAQARSPDLIPTQANT